MKTFKFFLALVLSLVIQTNTINAQWTKSNAPGGTYIYDMEQSDTNLYAAVFSYGIHRSNDHGLTWTAKNNGLLALETKCLTINDAFVFEAGWGVCRSGNLGENWTPVTNGLLSLYTYSLTHSDLYTYVGSLNGYVYYTDDDGDEWIPIPISGTDKAVNQLLELDSMIFAATDGSGIFRTSDDGAHWVPVNNGLANLTILSLEVSGTTLYAGTYWDSFYMSTDYGETWINSTNNLPLAPDKTVMAIAFDGSTIFTGVDRAGVYASLNNGANWQRISEGLSYNTIKSLAVSGPNLIAGTDNGIWWRPLSDIYNFLGSESAEKEMEPLLQQNYPNPAQSTTVIPLYFSCRSHASIKLYDKTGRITDVIAEEDFAPGDHTLLFDVSWLPNGIYYYTLTSGDRFLTRPLVVIK